jgi:hypothetical protein
MIELFPAKCHEILHCGGSVGRHCHKASQHRVRKVKSTGLQFHFLFFLKKLWHPVWTQFPKAKFIRHSFVKKGPWNLWKMQGKLQNGESSVLLNLIFHCKHQIFVNHRRLATPWIIMHIFASFIKVSHPSPYHWITHGMFSIHLTKLMMIVNWFHVSCSQETDYRPYFTWGRLLDFLEHCKHIGHCVNAVCLQIASVPSQRTNKLCTHAHCCDHSIAVALFANGTYFVDMPRT